MLKKYASILSSYYRDFNLTYIQIQGLLAILNPADFKLDWKLVENDDKCIYKMLKTYACIRSSYHREIKPDIYIFLNTVAGHMTVDDVHPLQNKKL